MQSTPLIGKTTGNASNNHADTTLREELPDFFKRRVSRKKTIKITPRITPN